MFEILKPTFISFFLSFKIQNIFAIIYCRVNHFDSLSCFSCSFNINQYVIKYNIYCTVYPTACSVNPHTPVGQYKSFSMPAQYAPIFS